jgi:hypothetical protein
MNQQEVFNRIGGIIKELSDQFNYLHDDPAKINELELELFVANAHFLANHAEVLKKLNLHALAALPPSVPPPVAVAATPPAPPVEPPATAKEERHFEPVVQSSPVEDDRPVPHIDLSGDTPEDDYSYMRQPEPETIRHELEIDDSWIDDEDDIPLIAEPELLPQMPEKPVAAAPPVPSPAIEKPAPPSARKEEPEVLTINQRMSAQLSNKHETALPPVTDLRSAITLNDKLLFVKDLFNGYSLAYSEAIDILNRYNSFEEADKYLKSTYSAKNHWDDKPETAAKFYALLKRRYA